MGVGKYSPTVSRSYMNDRDWWRKASLDGNVDPEGYDSYGYSEGGDGPDRAGYTELDYLQKWDEDSGYYAYNSVSNEWYNKIITFENVKATANEK